MNDTTRGHLADLAEKEKHLRTVGRFDEAALMNGAAEEYARTEAPLWECQAFGQGMPRHRCECGAEIEPLAPSLCNRCWYFKRQEALRLYGKACGR